MYCGLLFPQGLSTEVDKEQAIEKRTASFLGKVK